MSKYLKTGKYHKPLLQYSMKAHDHINILYEAIKCWPTLRKATVQVNGRDNQWEP